MEEIEGSLLDLPWEIRYDHIYHDFTAEDFCSLACVSKRFQTEMNEDPIWFRLVERMKQSWYWDRWLNQLSARTFNFYPKLQYAVFKVILTHKATGTRYVQSSKGRNSTLIRNVLVDLLVHLEDIYALPAHLALLFHLFTYSRHGTSVHLSKKIGFNHRDVRVRHGKIATYLEKNFKESGSKTKLKIFKENRYIRTFCEPFATLTFCFSIKWHQKPLFARKKDRIDLDAYNISKIDQYWLFDFASASPLCPEHVKRALEDYRTSKKPPNREYLGPTWKEGYYSD